MSSFPPPWPYPPPPGAYGVSFNHVQDTIASPSDFDPLFSSADHPFQPTAADFMEAGVSLPDDTSRQIPSGSADVTPDSNPPSPSFSASIPPLLTLMPENPRLFVVPGEFSHLPPERIPFPYNYVARNLKPPACAPFPLENHPYFAAKFDDHSHVITDQLSLLYDNLRLATNERARWLPCASQEQTNWFVREGFGQVDAFMMWDLEWFLTDLHSTQQTFPCLAAPPSVPQGFPQSSSPPAVGPAIPLTSPFASPPPVRFPMPASPSWPPFHVPPAPPPPFNSFQSPLASHPWQSQYQSAHNSSTATHVPFGNQNIPPSQPSHQDPWQWLQNVPPHLQSVLFKKKELGLPKWDGNVNSWNTMHDKLIAELATINKLHILQETHYQ